jgi:hypothetical protein
VNELNYELLLLVVDETNSVTAFKPEGKFSFIRSKEDDQIEQQENLD